MRDVPLTEVMSRLDPARAPRDRVDLAGVRALLRDREALKQTIKNVPWRAGYHAWPDVGPLEPGYTLLLPVPGDLPVFLHLALANAQRQDAAHRVETLVVPDQMTPEFEAAFEVARSTFDVGPLRLVEPSATDRALRRLAHDEPSKNYFIQVRAGVAASRTTHALLHDADLFIHDEGFLARHYRRCADEGLVCLGVSPCWDGWLRDHGFGHVVATWELMLDVRWARSFHPWKHRGHHSWLDGEWHGSDVTLHTQAVTPPERVGLHDAVADFTHFNWVIGIYRHFHRGGDRPFEDHRFVLLLNRLLADALAESTGTEAAKVDLPSVDELIAGVADPTREIVYGAAARENYGEFRAKVARIIAGPLFEERAVTIIEDALRRLDAAFEQTADAPAVVGALAAGDLSRS